MIDDHTDGRQEFELLLPLPSSGRSAVTHIVALSGAQPSFERALHDRISRDLVVASVLYGPMNEVSLGELADLLNSIDDVTVLSIDRVGSQPASPGTTGANLTGDTSAES